MAQIIVSSRYLKSGKRGKTKRRNFTKYIATRESVEKRPQNTGRTTDNQKQLISELIKEFPMAKQYLEYADYNKNPTSENATELISTIIERHADVIGNRRNFVGYMAKRPGAERRGEHGLFTDSDAPIDLNAVANEVAEHPGYVWTHVVSLRREDAVRLGYTNSNMWRELVKRHIDDISKAQNIPLSNLKWYAAFHDTTHHPHIHLIVYSTDPRQGYLTKEGMAAIRSAFANDIFHEDMKSIYQAQTLTRDELKALSENNMEEIVAKLGDGEVDERLVISIQKLYEQLKTTKGKKLYGYLTKEVKQTVDEIFILLSQDVNIQKLYDKWCEFEKAKYRMYTQKDKELPALVDNIEFRSVRNMIIRAVLKIDDTSQDTDAPVITDSDNEEDVILENIIRASNVNESTDTTNKERSNKRKQAQKFIDSSGEERDIEKGVELLTELADGGDSISAYNLAKVLLDDNEYHNTEKAVQLLKENSTSNNWCSYLLGKLYLFGSYDIEKDKAEAVKWLNISAKSGNEYAQRLLDNSDNYQTTMLAGTVTNLIINLGRIIEEDNRRSRKNISRADRKLLRIIQRKKEELGIKSDGAEIQYEY